MMTLQITVFVWASMTLMGCTADQNNCRTVQSIRDRILRGHVTKITTGKSFERCTIDCEKQSDCFSINYVTSSATCQMNNTTAQWYPKDFVPLSGAFYMDSLVRQYEANTYCKAAALGMANGEVKDAQIMSSSTHPTSRKSMGRLNFDSGSWTPSTDDQHQWYQVTFAPHTKVFTQIATQGDGMNWWWVTNYYIDYKKGTSQWLSYSEDGNTPMMFKGNTDRTNIVKNTFTKPFIADTIKIKPVSFTGRIALRIELYGCDV